MKRIAVFFFFAGVCLLLVKVAYSQQRKGILSDSKKSFSIEKEEVHSSKKIPEVLAEKMTKKISLDLRGMEIVDTLKFLAKQGSLNIVATKDVKGRVTLFLKGVTIRDMLDIILLTNDLAMTVTNNVITIMTESEYEALYGEKYTDKKEVKIVKLKYAAPKKVESVLKNIKSKIGKVTVDANTGTVILMDTPERIKEMRRAISNMDISTVKRVLPTETEVFELDYAKVGDIKDELSNSLGENIGSIRADERSNTLVITALPHKMEKIKKEIKAFDIQTKSVFIDVRILELTLQDNYYYGIEWSKIFRKSHDLQLDGVYPFTSSGSSQMQLTLGELSSDDYETTVDMLKHVGKVQILSSPQIYVNNNQEAKLMVGSREAYVTIDTTTGEATTTTSENIEFVDVGITLHVKPVINKKGYVKLHIKPDISSVRDWLETSEGNKIPIVETSNVETDVLVKDGHTIIMAGLVKETIEKDEKKGPFLGDIPLLKNASRNLKKENERKELIMFLTPSVVTGKESKVKDTDKKIQAKKNKKQADKKSVGNQKKDKSQKTKNKKVKKGERTKAEKKVEQKEAKEKVDKGKQKTKKKKEEKNRCVLNQYEAITG